MALTAVFSVSALAQGTQPASATSASSTTIIAPIEISNSVPLAFGSFSSRAAGTLVLTSGGVQSSTGGVKLISAATGSPTAAKFTVKGQGNYAYTVTLPTSLTLTTAVAGTVKTMEVTTFVSSLTSGTGSLASGTADFTVGATLNVLADQVVGLYESVTPFTVTVNYN